MSLEKTYLYKFYFNIIYINDIKCCKHSNQVRYFIFEGARERKSVGSLGMLGFGVCFGGTPRDYVLQNILNMSNMKTSSTLYTSEITCNL